MMMMMMMMMTTNSTELLCSRAANQLRDADARDQ